MAGVYSKSDDIEPEHQVTCCLGNHPLQDPKLLPCQHSFCKGCLKTKVGQDRKEFTCPRCQLSIPLTEKDIDKLQDDVLYHMLKDTKDNPDCEMCRFEGKIVPGTFQCLDCGEVTCDQCKVAHTKTVITRSHRVVPIKDIQKGQKKELQKMICQLHSKQTKPEMLDYYCQDCACLVCPMCLLTHQPKGHSCKTLDEVYATKAASMAELGTKLQDSKRLDEEFVAILQQDQDHNKELQEKLENEVHQRAALFIDAIEKVKQDKLTEIKDHFERENTLTQVKLNETKNRIIRRDSNFSYAQAFLEHSAKAEFLQHENEMMKKLKNEIEAKCDKIFKINLLEMGEPMDQQIEDIISEAFGKFKTKTNLYNISGKCVYREWMNKAKVLFTRESKIGATHDMTLTENDDIVSITNDKIQICSSDGKTNDQIACGQLQDGWNVVAKGKDLIVSSKGADGNVFEIDLRGGVKKTITLPDTSQEYNNKGLTVDDDEGTVFISSHGTNSIYKCGMNEAKAKVFIPQGTHPDLNGPWYLCLAPDKGLVVSNEISNAIQKYDKQGSFLWQYKGQGDRALSSPRGICSDIFGYIYITDRYNHRIQVIKDGEFYKTVQIENHTYPWNIDIDKDSNIVCGFDSGKKFIKIKVWE